MFRRFVSNFAKPGLVLSVLAVMAALYGADQFLAVLEKRELGAQARRYAGTGRTMLAQGRQAEAIEAFRRALSLERDNRDYELSLADALISAKRPEAAVETLQDVLDEDSNDGPANLLMARAMTEEKRIRDADSFYHRAIYGSWPPGQEESKPVQARMELVRWLAGRDDQKALLGELIPLGQAAKFDPAIERQMPALYLQAGSLSQAEDAYRALIKEEPDAAEPYAGLGRVELEKGNYHAAHLAFEDAVRRKPGDAAVAREAQIAQSALDLDPTPRRLTSAEKLARSNQILALAVSLAQSCPSADPALAASAQKLLAEKPARSPTNEMAEVRLDLAEKLWRGRTAACPAPAANADLLATLMRKMAQ